MIVVPFPRNRSSPSVNTSGAVHVRSKRFPAVLHYSCIRTTVPLYFILILLPWVLQIDWLFQSDNFQVLLQLQCQQQNFKNTVREMNKRNLKAIDLGRCLWHLDQLGLHTTAFVEILSLANCFQSSAMQVVVSFPRLFVKLIWDWYGLVEVESSCPRQLWGLVSYFCWFVCRDYAVGFAGSRWEGLLFSSPDTQSIKICWDHSHRHRKLHCTPHKIQMIRCMYGICLEFFRHLHFFCVIIMPQNHQKPILRRYLTLNLFMSLFLFSEVRGAVVCQRVL